MSELPSIISQLEQLNKQASDLPIVYVGVDKMLEDLFQFASEQKAINYPPFDVIKTDIGYDIVIAVAGFEINELFVDLDNYGVLTVSGKRQQSQPKEAYIHKGIAARQFSRKWNLNRDLHSVKDIIHKNGLLTISIQETAPSKPETLRLNITAK
jgi:molecular chaperone IbpA